MLRGLDIVCFANDWDSDPLSKRHVMVRLARHNRVLWVNSLGCRNPTASSRDLRRAAGKLRAFMGGRRQVQPNLWVTSPLVVPFHGNRLARRLNRVWLSASLRFTCRGLGMRRPISWVFLPSAGEVAGSLGESLVIYHCVDEYSEFTGTDARAILEMEARLAARADLVIVSAEPLLRSKGRLNPATHLITHGVEVEHFGRALDPSEPVPEVLRELPSPVIGFFGLIADWVDLELIAFLAQQRPAASFVLVGKADTDVSAIERLPNVHLVGRRPYAELPGYCKGFDAAILPFRINELTIAANPLKLREYLAAGLPVVATALPEAQRLAPWVRVAEERGQFLRLLDDAICESTPFVRQATARAMASESWDHKVAEMSRLVAALLPGGAAAGRAAEVDAVGEGAVRWGAPT